MSAALLTIATRRLDSAGPVTKGVVSKLGQGMFATPVRVGSGMSSRRAIQSSFMIASHVNAENTIFLRAGPKHQLTETREMLVTLDDGQKMVAGELPHLAWRIERLHTRAKFRFR